MMVVLKGSLKEAYVFCQRFTKNISFSLRNTNSIMYRSWTKAKSERVFHDGASGKKRGLEVRK